MKKLIALPVLFLVFFTACKKQETATINFEIDLLEYSREQSKSVTITADGFLYFLDEKLEDYPEVKKLKLNPSQIQELQVRLEEVKPVEGCNTPNIAATNGVLYTLNVKHNGEETTYRANPGCESYKTIDAFVAYLFELAQNSEANKLFLMRSELIDKYKSKENKEIKTVSDFRFIPEEKPGGTANELPDVQTLRKLELIKGADPLILMGDSFSFWDEKIHKSFVVFYNDNTIFKYCMLLNDKGEVKEIRKKEVVGEKEKQEMLNLLQDIQLLQKTMHFVAYNANRGKWDNVVDGGHYILGIYKNEAFSEYETLELEDYKAKPQNNYGYKEVKQIIEIIKKIDFYNELFGS
ncbi:hypothetical protein ABS768_13105 [Flavobacterium sp. ST-75]|uniref:Lipoprotein n=1 Tax=Flavobacterium rhizophilum TaxID=3163296 RepID=A0ABW8YDX3_9FLAO